MHVPATKRLDPMQKIKKLGIDILNVSLGKERMLNLFLGTRVSS
jgi:hypothetical protein